MDTSLIQNALASATASIVARTFTHPLDTAKARLQANYPISATESGKRPYRGTRDVLVKTYRTEGIRGLYRGFSAVLVGGTPGTMVYLTSYDIVKNALAEVAERSTNQPLAGTGLEFLVHFVSGMTAETLSCIVYVPVDVVKERMQVQHPTNGSSSSSTQQGIYRGSWDAVKQIARTEGLAGIYRGYYATLGSFGPFSAFYFVFYERFKLWARKYVSEDPSQDAYSLANLELPFPYVVVSSATAGALASFVTSPLDMAKLRLQVQRGTRAQGHAPLLYRGVIDCLRKVYQEGGVRGLFRGAGARMIHYAPATTITMTCYEKCRSLIGRILFEEENPLR